MHYSLYIESLRRAGMHLDIHTDQPGKYIILDQENSCAYRCDSSGHMYKLSNVELIAVLDALLKFYTNSAEE